MVKTQAIFEYKGRKYPEYIRQGNAVENILPIAQKFCKGKGLDIGGTPEWHFPGAKIINSAYGVDNAFDFPNYTESGFDYIFSSHCLEHLPDYIAALEYWRDSLRIGGQLFLYLPHPEMEYWQPQNCRKHLHVFESEHIFKVLETLGFNDIFCSGRDLYWSFAITGVRT